jgi:hypothetical protein
VKITVIATGFRTAPTRHRQPETRTSFAARNDDAMDFPSHGPADEPTPGHIMSSADGSSSELSTGGADGSSFDDRSFGDRSFDDRSFDDSSLSSGAGTGALSYGSHTSQPIQLDPTHTSIGSFEHDDLDVPAFLRKRNDVM